MSLKSIVFKIRSIFRPSIDSVDKSFSKTLGKLEQVIEDQAFITKEAEAAIERAEAAKTDAAGKTKRATIFQANLKSLMGMDSDGDGVPDIEQLGD